jgi:hypothetical protein
MELNHKSMLSVASIPDTEKKNKEGREGKD